MTIHELQENIWKMPLRSVYIKGTNIKCIISGFNLLIGEHPLVDIYINEIPDKYFNIMAKKVDSYTVNNKFNTISTLGIITGYVYGNSNITAKINVENLCLFPFGTELAEVLYK